MSYQDRANRRVYGWRRGGIRYFDINNFFLQPVSEARYTFCEVTARFERWIDDGAHIYFGEAVRDQGSEVLGKGTESVIISLRQSQFYALGLVVFLLSVIWGLWIP